MRRILAIGALLATAPAAGESVTMTGTFAAKAREVALLRSIAVGRFGGRDGAALAIALERRLADNGYFRVSAGGDAEGRIAGAVSVDVDQSSFTKREKKCVEKVEKKCVREEEEEIRCTRRRIGFTADVRVADTVRDRVLFSRPIERRDENSWCAGDNAGRTTESIVRGMIDDVAGELAAAFAPRTERYSVRFLETTKAMPKEQVRAFKDAVRQTKTDLPGACAAWEDIDRATPDQPAVVFNLGLCAESRGVFDVAEPRYLRAGQLGRGGEADEGIGRIRDMLAARADAAARDRR